MPTKPFRITYVVPGALTLLDEAYTGAFPSPVDHTLMQVAVALARDDTAGVRLLAFEPGLAAPRRLSYRGIDCAVLPSLRDGLLAPARTVGLMRAALGAFRLGADIVQSAGTGPQTLLAAALAAVQGAGWVHAMVSKAEFEAPAPEGPALARAAARAGRIAVTRGPDVVVVQHEALQETLLRSRVRETIVIPAGIALPPVPAGADAAGPILWIGRADAAHRPDLLAKLAHAMPEARFRAVGIGRHDPSPWQGALNALPNIELLGHIPHGRIASALRGVSVLINTAVPELALPWEFLEAWSQGIPVVAYELDPGGVIKRHACGLVTPDLLTMARRLREMRSGGGTLRVLGDNARRYTERHHKIEDALAAYRAVYARFLRE